MDKYELARIAIQQAKRFLDRNEPDSAELANYVLRDLKVTKDADLAGLSWAMHRDGSMSHNDVLGLIEHLEKYLAMKGEVNATSNI